MNKSGIRMLCPTRWTVRADAMNSILQNYTILLDLWQASEEVVTDTEMKARLLGVMSAMRTYNYLFGLSLGYYLLRFTDNLSRALQSSTMSACEGQSAAANTVTQLRSLPYAMTKVSMLYGHP